MKPPAKLNRIYQEKLKKYLVFYIGLFLCMYRPGISAGTCGRPGRTNMSNYEPNGTREFNVNDKIHYKCTEKNHVILGNPERRCQRNGSWSDEIPVCSKVASIERVHLIFQDSESEDLSGYTVDGNITTCSEAAVRSRIIWKGFLVTSINISAVRVSFIGMKEVDISVRIIQEDAFYGAKSCDIKSEDEGLSIKTIKTVTFYCPPATIGKYVHVTCNNLPLTFCEISVLQPPGSKCLSPDIPLYGNGRKRTTIGISTEEVYTFQCDEGYKRWGSLNVTCQTGGRWSPKSPICEEIYCHVPEDIENGRVDYIENKGKIPYNGTARYRCKEGFYLSGKPVIRCAAWQTWDYPSPICEFRAIEITSSTRSHPHIESWKQTNVIHCRNLPQIANGALIVNSSLVGSTAWLKCSEGFRSVSDDHVVCLPSGRWSSHSLLCSIAKKKIECQKREHLSNGLNSLILVIECEANPIIPFGKGILLNNSSYYGSPLQIKCNKATHSSIIRSCDEHGSWGDLHICVEITCGAFSSEHAGNDQWIPVNGSTSLYVLICPENFHIEGSPAVIQCLSNGSWSYTSARCQKSLSSFWGSNWTPSLVLIAAVAAGVATAVVILCLSVAFLVMKKRRAAQTNTTVFHLENTAQKDRTKEINSQRPKHHSAAENYNTVELRCKSVCTFPRKPRSALPNLPVDADPVYAQPFENATTKKTSVTAANKKDDLYNTHIYAEPINSRRNTPNHIVVNTDNLEMETDKRLSNRRTDLENKLPSSVQTDQQNCDKKCAIYDSSGNASLSSMKVTNEVYQSQNDNIELGTLKKNLEYLELL